MANKKTKVTKEDVKVEEVMPTELVEETNEEVVSTEVHEETNETPTEVVEELTKIQGRRKAYWNGMAFYDF